MVSFQITYDNTNEMQGLSYHPQDIVGWMSTAPEKQRQT